MDSELTQPWEQRAGEPGRWYARFERFRLAGPSRSLLAMVNEDRQQRGKKKTRSTPQAWTAKARRWQWRERAQAWDQQQQAEVRSARAREIEEMNRRHIQEARALQSKGIQRLKSLEVEHLSVNDMYKLITGAAKLERAALGEPDHTQAAEPVAGAGTAVVFSLEHAVAASAELEKTHDQL